MANTVDLNIRVDMASVTIFRLECLDCDRLAERFSKFRNESEAHAIAHAHIDLYDDHRVTISPAIMVSKRK